MLLCQRCGMVSHRIGPPASLACLGCLALSWISEAETAESDEFDFEKCLNGVAERKLALLCPFDLVEDGS